MGLDTVRNLKGPGNTEGGYGEFFSGLIMLVFGGYLLLENVTVRSGFFTLMGYNSLGPLFGVLLLGIFFLFFDARSWIGWGLTVVATGALVVGLVSSLTFTWHQTSALTAIFMFGLPAAGLGLMLGALRDHGTALEG